MSQVKDGQDPRDLERAVFEALDRSTIAGAVILQMGILYCNEAFARMHGYKASELIGMDNQTMWKTLWPEGPPEEAVKRLVEDRQRALDGLPPNPPRITGMRGKHKDGSPIDEEWWANFVMLRSKPAFVGTVLDVTQRNRAEAEVRKGLEQIQATLVSTVSALATTLEMRDPYTAGHQRRVAELACAIGAEMGLPVEQIDGMSLAATVHDIGKIRVPADILTHPGRLSDAEFTIIKTHPQVGFDILKDVKFVWPVSQIVLQHHERIDGTGYPEGLRGDAILIESRIIGVADVVEAMASHRPYRAALGIERSLEEIEEHRGTRYDADVADACVSLFREWGYAFPDPLV